MDKIKIGKIVELEGLNIVVEVTEKNISEKINFRVGSQVTPLVINKLISINLLNGKEVIGKIEKIYENNHFYTQDYLKKNESKICILCNLIGVYDPYLEIFDEGIVNFPLINSDVYSTSSKIKKNIMNIDSKFKLKIGKSYSDNNIDIFADPDILLGKHLGVFGNTGTGKSCTVASIIQGLKRRLYDKDNNFIEINSKIIIFDSNNEYLKAFSKEGINCRKIEKNELKLPHFKLSDSEYYQLFGASQGVQAPILKEVLTDLRKKPSYKIEEILSKIDNLLSEKSKDKQNNVNNFSYNQWYNWLNTMINRISRIQENETLSKIINCGNKSTIDEIKEDKNDVVLIDSDFDKEELDVIMFLFSKILYNECKNENIVLVLEEAHRYINEEDFTDYKLGNYYIQKIAREGRKFGISLIISSQRPSELSKSVISQCNSFIVHKLTNKNDNELISRILSSRSKGFLNLLSGLEKQHALVSGEAFGFTDIIKIETAVPTPQSEDPKVIEKWIKNKIK